MKIKILIVFLAMILTVPHIVLAEEKELEFIDFKSHHPHYYTVKTMVNKGYISGYDDGRFKAHQNISRKQTAALITRLNRLPKATQSKKLPKDLSTKHPNYAAIMQLYNLDLLNVDKKGNINPNQDLTRGEVAKIFVVTFNFKGENDLFTDTSFEIKPYASALLANYIPIRYKDKKGDTTFRENEPVTRIDYTIFMYSALNVTGALYTGSTNENAFYELIAKEKKNYTDLLLPKTEGNLNKVELTKKLEREYAKIAYNKCFSGTGGRSLITKYTKTDIEEHIQNLADQFNMSTEVLTKQIAEAYSKGIVATNDGYSEKRYGIYINLLDGLLYVGRGSDTCQELY